jgi:hypothetical protein
MNSNAKHPPLQHLLCFALSTCLQADAQVVLEAVQQDASTMHLAANQLFSNRQFVLAAVACDATAVTFAAPELLADASFRAEAQRANSLVGHYFINTELSPSLQSLNRPSTSSQLHSLHAAADPSKPQPLESAATGATTPQSTRICSNAASSPSKGADNSGDVT